MYKNELNFPYWIAALAVCVVLVVFGFCIAFTDGPDDFLKREAVARGHAEFVAEKDGNVEFKWKEIK